MAGAHRHRRQVVNSITLVQSGREWPKAQPSLETTPQHRFMAGAHRHRRHVVNSIALVQSELQRGRESMVWPKAQPSLETTPQHRFKWPEPTDIVATW